MTIRTSITHITTKLLRHLAAAAFCALIQPLSAAPGAEKAPVDPSDSVITAAEQPEIRISMLTAAPGSQIYQLEGHSALRMRRGDLDVAVNWGVFDFAAPNFVWRFCKGETDYEAWAFPTAIVLEDYRRQGRRVTEQALNLTPSQARMIYDLVGENLRPENRVYRYNYVKDNCATRPLRIIQRAMGDSLQLRYAPAAGETFRSEMSRYHANYPWYQFGIDLALGSGIDYPLTPAERDFAPVHMMQTLAQATSTAPDGSTHPLVSATDILVDGPGQGMALAPTPRALSPVAVSLYLLVITVVISIRDMRRGRLSRWFDSTLFGVFFLLGLAQTFLIFVSTHEATSPNWTYLWLNPLCLIPAVGVWIKSCRSVVYCYQICNFVVLLALLASPVLFGQRLNAAFPMLIAADMVRSAVFILLYRKELRKKSQSGATPAENKATRKR